MTDRKNLSAYFAEYVKEVEANADEAYRAVHYQKLWATYFEDAVGKIYPPELSERRVIELWDGIQARVGSRTDLFACFLLLRSIFEAVEADTGLTLPSVALRSSFSVAEEKMSEQTVYLLDEAALSDMDLSAIAFWLVLHAPLRFEQVLHLRPEHLLLGTDTLSVCYDPRKNLASKKPASTDEMEHLSVPVDERAYAFIASNLDKWKNNEFLFNLVARRTLTNKLANFCDLTGLPRLTLSDLESCERITCTKDVVNTFKPSEKMAALAEALAPSFEKLPGPLRDHAQRVKYIASFFTEHLRTLDFFLDLDMEETDLLFAVYYHDIGKSTMPPDDFYPGTRAQTEQNARYRYHVERGLDVLNDAFGAPTATFAPESTEGLIIGAISDHHERPDGKGFPLGKKNIHFAGALAALCDALDHRLFMDDPGANPVDVIDKIITETSAFDPRLLSILSEQRLTFYDFIDDLRGIEKKRQSDDAFGIRYVFRPLKDAKTREVVAYEAHLMINDRYYGLLDGENILSMMENHPNYLLFTRLQMKHILRTVIEAREKDRPLPVIFVKLSVAATSRDTFFSDLLRFIIRYNTRYRAVVFCVDESDLVSNEVDAAELCEKFHVLGAGFGISAFGAKATLLHKLGQIHPDAIIFDRSYAGARGTDGQNFVTMTTVAAKANGIATYIYDVDSESSFGALSELGLTAVGGSVAGEEITEYEWMTR